MIPRKSIRLLRPFGNVRLAEARRVALSLARSPCANIIFVPNVTPVPPSLTLSCIVIFPMVLRRAFCNKIDTSHKCTYEGYRELEADSWPSKCAPNKDDWFDLNPELCGYNGLYPEEFWNCADISITPSETAQRRRKLQKQIQEIFCER